MNLVTGGGGADYDAKVGHRKHRTPSARTGALFLDANIRHCFDLVDPRKTCLLRFIVLILAIHAATSFEAAADGSHSGNDVPLSDPDHPEPGELIITNPAAFRFALAEYNETGMLIEFFLPWCGHSRRLRPELSQVRSVLPHENRQADTIRIVPILHILRFALGPRTAARHSPHTARPPRGHACHALARARPVGGCAAWRRAGGAGDGGAPAALCACRLQLPGRLRHLPGPAPIARAGHGTEDGSARRRLAAAAGFRRRAFSPPTPRGRNSAAAREFVRRTATGNGGA
jgi:hypothetical protein